MVWLSKDVSEFLPSDYTKFGSFLGCKCEGKEKGSKREPFTGEKERGLMNVRVLASALVIGAGKEGGGTSRGSSKDGRGFSFGCRLFSSSFTRRTRGDVQLL